MFRIPIALVLLVTAALGLAQDKKELDYTLAVDVELVQLPVSVLDKKGHPFRNLGRQHFKVFEDRIEQDIVGPTAGRELDPDHAGGQPMIDLGQSMLGVVGVDADVAKDAAGVFSLETEQRLVPRGDIGRGREVGR